MPIYTYQCCECGLVQEVMCAIKDRNKSHPCNDCLGVSKRIIDLAAFQLRGDGWYKDGYGDKRSMSKEEKIERSTVKTTSTNTGTGESKVVSEKPLDPKTPVARSLVDD